MRTSTFLKLALISVASIAQSVTQSGPPTCPKCDCSHFPIDTTECVRCCFYEKGEVTSVSGSEVTVAPLPESKPKPTKKFKIRKDTQINGNLRVGANATIYYHTEEGEDVATRIEGEDYYRGLLIPGNSEGPQDTCATVLEGARRRGIPVPELPPNAMKVFLGNSEVYSAEQKLVVLKIGTNDVLVLQKTERGLSVTAEIRDAKGSLAAIIVDDNFFINAHNSFEIQGPGTNSLRVLAPDGALLLNITYPNSRVIKILGTFYGAGGQRFSIGDEQQVFEAPGGGKVVTKASCFGGSPFGTIEVTEGGAILVR